MLLKKKEKPKVIPKNKQFLNNPNSSSDVASAALPLREVVDASVDSFAPPMSSTEVLDRGPFWINDVRYIRVGDLWMQDDFTPGQTSRSVSPRLSDSSNMIVDS